MSTYRELVFLISDLVKTLSDDSIINENHIFFLLGKYRAYLLKQKYGNEAQSSAASGNYQTICIDLIKVPMVAGCSDNCVCSLGADDTYLRSSKKLPKLMDLGTLKITGSNRFSSNVTMVSPYRMEYVGYSTWLQNVIYGTVAEDNYLYLKSNNRAFLELKNVHLTGIFEDPVAASEQMYCDNEDCGCGCGETCTCGDNCNCNHSGLPCDEFDREFPLEEDLVTQLISLVINEVLGAAWRPKDGINNANDDLAELANFVRNYMKKGYNDVVQNG